MGAKTKRAILSEWLAVGSRDVSVSYGAMPWNGRKNEKYIYLDFAWILRAIDWIGGWIDIGLCAVVLVARPFLLRVRLHGARRWPVAVVDSWDDRVAVTRLNAWKYGHL